MKPRRIYLGNELRDTLILAGPIVLNQAGQMSMGLVDTMVAGRISTNAIAGLGLGANLFWTFTSVCSGILLALDTWFSQAAGAGDEASMRRFLSQSMWTCLAITLLAGAGLLTGGLIYNATAAPGPIKRAVLDYVLMVSWALPSIFLFFALQRYWQARHRVIAFSAIIVGANLLNLVGNMALGLGWWGFPRMEVAGLALSTVICRYAMLAAAAGYTLYLLKPVERQL